MWKNLIIEFNNKKMEAYESATLFAVSCDVCFSLFYTNLCCVDAYSFPGWVYAFSARHKENPAQCTSCNISKLLWESIFLLCCSTRLNVGWAYDVAVEGKTTGIFYTVKDNNMCIRWILWDRKENENSF